MRQQSDMFDEQLAEGRRLDDAIEANLKEVGYG